MTRLLTGWRGVNGDITYQVTDNREFRDSALTVNLFASEDGKASGNSYNVESNTYTVVKGDSLWKIAKSAYGKNSMWKTFYEANKDIAKDPNLIFIGQVLTVPAN